MCLVHNALQRNRTRVRDDGGGNGTISITPLAIDGIPDVAAAKIAKSPVPPVDRLFALKPWNLTVYARLRPRDGKTNRGRCSHHRQRSAPLGLTRVVMR